MHKCENFNMLDVYHIKVERERFLVYKINMPIIGVGTNDQWTKEQKHWKISK